MADKELQGGADAYGWIKLNRKLRTNDFWVNSGPFDKRSAWVDLMMAATYDESVVYSNSSKGTVKLAAGEILTSIKSLRARWDWSYDKVDKFLNSLEEMGMIEQRRETKYTIIKLVNWHVYQDAVKPRKGDAPASRNQAPAPAPAPAPATAPAPKQGMVFDLDKDWDEMSEAEQIAYLRK